jgi:hypothetical protein
MIQPLISANNYFFSLRTIVLPASCDSCPSIVCFSLSVTDENSNFSAVQSQIELKLGGDLRLVSQISVHALVSKFNYVSFCNQKNKQKKPDCPDIESCVLFLLNWTFVYVYGCQQKAQIVNILKKRLIGHQFGYQMKGLCLVSKIMLLIYTFVYIL